MTSYTCKLDCYTDVLFQVVQAPDAKDFTDYAELCECTSCKASVIVPPVYERIFTNHDELWQPFKYCPNCGAKVVD